MTIKEIIKNSKSKTLKNSIKKYVVCSTCGKGEWYSIFYKSHNCGSCAWKQAYLPEAQAKRVRTRRENHSEPKYKYWTKVVNGKQVKEHRWVMEQFLGRELSAEEVVHHIDGNKLNNDISNLMLFPTQAAHTLYHHQLRKLQQSA